MLGHPLLHLSVHEAAPELSIVGIAVREFRDGYLCEKIELRFSLTGQDAALTCRL